MEDYRHLCVDLDDLVEALDSHHPDMEWYLDLNTGEVLFASADTPMEGLDDLEEDVDYMAIFPMSPRQSFEIMEDFVDALPEGTPKQALWVALDHRKPFAAFKDELGLGPLREQWCAFHDTRMRGYAMEWLEEHVPGAQV